MSIRQLPSPLKPADWLNPRRRLNAERLLAYTKWHGRKVYLDHRVYGDLRDDHQLDKYQVDQAADDLWSLGVLEMTLAGDRVVLTLLNDDVDAQSAPAAKPAGQGSQSSPPAPSRWFVPPSRPRRSGHQTEPVLDPDFEAAQNSWTEEKIIAALSEGE